MRELKERDLRDRLVEVYHDKLSIDRVVGDAGIDATRVPTGGKPVDVWAAILQEARNSGRSERLKAVVAIEYPVVFGPLLCASASSQDAAAPDEDRDGETEYELPTLSQCVVWFILRPRYVFQRVQEYSRDFRRDAGRSTGTRRGSSPSRR